MSVAIPYSLAQEMSKPMTLVLRTPRGVRFVDLGIAPKVATDAAGRIDGARDHYIKDCLEVVVDSRGAGVDWGMPGVVDVGIFKARPPEEPDWAQYTHEWGGFVAQLIHLSGLDAGELIRFRSATHAVDVTADAAGRAIVPVLFPLSPILAPARLVRANGLSLEGHVGVSSASFEQHITLPGRLAGGIRVSASGLAHVTTHSRRGVVSHVVSAFGAIGSGRRHGNEAALNPQPLPPVEHGDAAMAIRTDEAATRRAREAVERAGIKGIDHVLSVPGFASGGTAVAVMANGARLVLDLRQGVRIAGTFAGPIAAVHVAGGWAVTGVGEQTAVFRVSAGRRAARLLE